ncbi:HIRAN domain-containing protein [Fontimonas thermophila]|uniref:HIRAN domain-containing protein n=1 Tax=Fontimonas thermophila TaxID=1076937 RepID=A0A1I2H6M0_9GAMM|nr:HIRAN domain-containing protein [Fontimonas thermophila]SFF25332.1 HIRAN domain-containing protein [Fontimonas thermophila]
MEDVSSPVHAVPPAPTFASTLAVRARLWLPGQVFAPEDGHPRLWLSLSDGRVLALRLGQARLGDDAVIAPILAALTDDVGGHHYQLQLPQTGFVQVLYAAPVLPNPVRWHAGFWFDADFQRFAATLDAELMRLLLWLEREPTPPAVTRRDGETPHPLPRRFFASVRNYNRLATLPPVLRERRLQALARFPALVAPVLLSFHHSPNVEGGRRHAWREKDQAVEAAIDAGRDLTGALAQHYGISRSLVRAPVNTALWPAPSHAARRGYLALLDALPANQRPTLSEFERWQLYLANYFGLLGETERGDPLPQRPEVHRGAFRLGWTRTWEAAARRYGNLHTALADCRDFLEAVRERAAALTASRYGPRLGRLAAGWLACHGLLGLLGASGRWHRQGPTQIDDDLPGDLELPAIVGRFEREAWLAVELTTPRGLLEEGLAMHHCVGNRGYWEASVAGTRIFSLRGPAGERATAEYRPALREDVEYDTRYCLVQLRGPCNREVAGSMHAFASEVEAVLNEPARADARWAALEARGRIEVELLNRKRKKRLAQRFDAKTERQLAAVLAWLGQPQPGPNVLLVAPVAGYQYHQGPAVEAQFQPNATLSLTHERDNPHDPLAVRIDWQGVKLGYVPRPHNAEIAARLLAGEKLTARLAAFDEEAPPWERVVVEIATREAEGAGKLDGHAVRAADTTHDCVRMVRQACHR